MMEKDEEDFWRCAKHPSPPRSGVCPVCLRDRLLHLLCPDCSSLRPCSCASTSSSASTSSLSVGRRVADLIDSEPAFRRSRSVTTFQVLKPSADGKRWKGLWPFRKVKDEARLSKSRSIGVVIGDGKGKGWNWLPSPMKALRGRKAADVVQARSPLCRG